MSIVKHILKYAAPMKKLETYERFLFVGPHPDDIEIGAGALAAKLAAMGKEVVFCICTDGRYGDGYLAPGIDREEIIRIRREEALRSASVLGVEEIHFLELCDGGFYKTAELERALADVLEYVRPDVILAPDPDVISECHVDHRRVGRVVRKLACLAPYAGIMEQYAVSPVAVKAVAFYMTDRPNLYVNTTGYLKRQLYAIFRIHSSQFPLGSREADSTQLYLKLRALQYGVKAHGAAGEAYRMLDQLHMHCMPEATE